VKISARNQLLGTVRSVSAGQVMVEGIVDVDGGHELVAAITGESARRLGLVPGTRVVAVEVSSKADPRHDEGVVSVGRSSLSAGHVPPLIQG
jgi:molybdopterin-binding protein